jgi:hypothetical protein
MLAGNLACRSIHASSTSFVAWRSIGTWHPAPGSVAGLLGSTEGATGQYLTALQQCLVW